MTGADGAHVRDDVHGDVVARGVTHDHAVNVLAQGPPRWLRDVLAAALDDLATYPDERPAVEALAAHHGVAPEQVVPLNGAAQGFALLPALGPAAPAIVHPQFTEPDRALPRATHVVLDPPWHLDPRRIPADADLVVIGNPTNPTGVLHRPQAIAALTRPGRHVVVDEAFLPLSDDPTRTLAGTPGTIVLKSLTKHLAVPGLRVGYLVAGDRDTARRLSAARPPWSCNALALAALRAAPLHDAPHPSTADRERLARRLDAIPAVRVHPGQANFLLLEVDEAQRATRRLRDEHDLAIRPAHTFPGLGPNHVRVTVRGGAADDRLVAALSAVLAG